MYSKAIRQFTWVSDNPPHNLRLQGEASRASARLYNEKIGVCPGNCLKANQGGWQMHDGERQISFPAIGKMAGHRPWSFNKASIGHTIAYTDLGWPCDMGTCPICGGTGRVQPLKDGDPLPQ